MQSNQPYNRVDNGIGAGIVGGAALGAAGAGALLGAGLGEGKLHSMNTSVSASRRSSAVNKQAKRLSSGKSSNLNKMEKQMNNIAKTNARVSSGISGAGNLSRKAFGSGKSRLITGSASILGGALIGGVTDKMNG